MTWYLVFGLMIGQYLGPMTKRDCEAAKIVFQSAQCKEPKTVTTCSFNNGASGYSCPNWDY
jgi:hypothetical protein